MFYQVTDQMPGQEVGLLDAGSMIARRLKAGIAKPAKRFARLAGKAHSRRTQTTGRAQGLEHIG